MLPHRLVSGCGLIQVRIPTDPRAKGWGGCEQGDRRHGSLPVDRATFFPEDHRIYNSDFSYKSLDTVAIPNASGQH